MIKKVLLTVLFFTAAASAQIYSDKDAEICNTKFEFAVNKNLAEKPMATVITEIGKSFLGVDYEAFAIEKDGEEQLVIHLEGLDCTTFLENSLTLARLVKQNKTTFEDYKTELTKIRYRDGVINHYPSRLHYFSDWIYNNQQKGIIKDVTKEIGGEPIKFNLFFMSKNPQYYKHLKENPEFIPVIKNQEKEINKREYYYIPKSKIAKLEDKIQDGDLIACTTNMEGLDIGHVGIAVKQKGRIHFMHAPQEGSKVQISKEPLPDYLAKVKKHTGIIVLRAVE